MRLLDVGCDFFVLALELCYCSVPKVCRLWCEVRDSGGPNGALASKRGQLVPGVMRKKAVPLGRPGSVTGPNFPVQKEPRASLRHLLMRPAWFSFRDAIFTLVFKPPKSSLPDTPSLSPRPLLHGQPYRWPQMTPSTQQQESPLGPHTLSMWDAILLSEPCTGSHTWQAFWPWVVPWLPLVSLVVFGCCCHCCY